MAFKNLSLDKVKRYVLKLLGDVGDQEAEEVATGAGASKLAKATRVVYAIGTIRVWQGQKYKKTGPNRWDKVFETSSKERDASVAATKAQIKKAPDLATLVRLIAANSKRFLTPEGKMDPIVGQLIRMAKERREAVAPKAKLSAKAPAPEAQKAQILQPQANGVQAFDTQAGIEPSDEEKEYGEDVAVSKFMITNDNTLPLIQGKPHAFALYEFLQGNVIGHEDRLPGYREAPAKIADLEGIQKEVNSKAVKDILGKWDALKDKPIVVIHYGDKSYVADGHHRLVAAIARGEKTIPAIHVDLSNFDLKADANGNIAMVDRPAPPIEKIIDKSPKVIAKKVTPVKDASKALSGANEENRNEVAAQVFGFDPADKPALPPPYEFKPQKVKIDRVNGEIQDFTPVLPINIVLADPKTILNKPRPSYIPDLSDEGFRQSGWKVCAVKIGENRYLLNGVQPEGGAVVSLDVLAATQHYWLNRAKATYAEKLAGVQKTEIENCRTRIPEYEKIVAKEKAEVAAGIRHNAYSEGYLEYLKNVVAGKVKPKIRIYDKQPRMLGDNRMTHKQQALFRSFTPDVKPWTAYRELNEDLKQKMGDMTIQYEDMLNTHAKGEETSYGKKGAKKDLLDSLGVLVKRQNGKPITAAETAEVKTWLSDVFGVYGDRSSMARKYGLLISHSGDVGMHARKAIGLFHPTYHAIGVASAGGGFTMAHEYAHFMDNYVGGQVGHHYASDKIGSDANVVAANFRKNMAKAQKSDYQNRTCECFARALEQYFAIKTGKGDQYVGERNKEGNHPTTEVFEREVMPAIDRWFKNSEAMLKSMQVALVLRRGIR